MRLQHEGAVPAQHDQVVLVPGEARPEQLGAGRLGQRPRLRADQQRREVDAAEQRLRRQRGVEGGHLRDQVVLLDPRLERAVERGGDALAQRRQQAGPGRPLRLRAQRAVGSVEARGELCPGQAIGRHRQRQRHGAEIVEPRRRLHLEAPAVQHQGQAAERQQQRRHAEGDRLGRGRAQLPARARPAVQGGPERLRPAQVDAVRQLDQAKGEDAAGADPGRRLAHPPPRLNRRRAPRAARPSARAAGSRPRRRPRSAARPSPRR